MTEEQIKHMVDRFLGWKLPSNFSPDNGISFDPVASKGTPHEYRREPSGTNVFDAAQADAMVRYMIEGMPSEPSPTTEDTNSRVEIMWCTDCGARFTEEEIKGWGCPKCGNQGIPCGTDKDCTVEINWHELHILVVWAENWARQCAANPANNASPMPRTVAAIARRLQLQHPDFGHLTLSGEIPALQADAAKAGIEIGRVESSVPRPEIMVVNGPGAVGHSHKLTATAGVSP